MAKRVHQPREDAEFDFILGMSGVPVLAYFTGTWPKAIEPAEDRGACQFREQFGAAAQDRGGGGR
jgi:hypothetical protein